MISTLYSLADSYGLYLFGGTIGAAVVGGIIIQLMSPTKAINKDFHSDIVPKKRSLHFNFEDVDISNWNGYGHFQSLFMNGLSLFFPVGEAFFVRAVQAHRGKAQVNEDPVLKQQVQAFIAQESMHGREHDRYNDVIKAKYPRIANATEQAANGVLMFAEKYLGQRHSLAVTVALEHWTALMGNGLLECPTIYSKGDPNLGLIWHWHAMEETEHKSVAYDVYMRSYGYNLISWLDKSFALVVATIILWTMVYTSFICMAIADFAILNPFQWYDLMRVHWGFKDSDGSQLGALRKCIIPWFDFFSPSFHPWQHSHDNSEMLKEMKELEKQLHQYAPDTKDAGKNKYIDEDA